MQQELPSLRLGPHVRQLMPHDGNRAYPQGAPLWVRGKEAGLLIDAALGTPTPRPDLHLLSHFHEDHVVDVASTGAPVLVHPADLGAVQSWEGFQRASGYQSPAWRHLVQETFRWQAVPHASALEVGAPIDLGGVRVHTVELPGHTPGHCGFLIEPDGVLYLGDLDLSGFGPYYGDACSSLTDMLDSLARAGEIEAAVYTTFHHKGPYNSPSGFQTALAAYRAAIHRRDEALSRLLTTRPGATAEQLVGLGVVYRPGTAPPFGAEGEARMIAAHLALGRAWAGPSPATAP